MKVFLYNLAIDTQNDQFHMDNSIEQKLSLIEEALKTISIKLGSPEYSNTTNNAIRAILVAPEYFFARSFPEHYLNTGPYNINEIPEDRRGRHYSYADYIKIRQGITVLSEHDKFKQILIVAGTIAWKTNIDEIAPSVRGTSLYAPVASYANRLSADEFLRYMESIGEPKTQDDWYTYMRGSPDSIFLKGIRLLKRDDGESYGGDDDLRVRVEHKRFMLNNVHLDPEEYIEYLRKFKHGFAYNTAFFYLNGKKVGEYSKHSDYQEVLFGGDYRELSIALLTDEPSIIEIEGIKFGIEICLDHAYSILKTYLSRSAVDFTVGDFDSGEYYSRNWENKEKKAAERFFKESADAYYRYRSFNGVINKLYYFSHGNKPRDITNLIQDFDQFFNVWYDGSSLYTNNQIRAAGGGSYSEILTQEQSVKLFEKLQIIIPRDFKPNVHLVLSACVNKNNSEGELFIHSSSAKFFNEPNENMQEVTYGVVCSGAVEIKTNDILNISDSMDSSSSSATSTTATVPSLAQINSSATTSTSTSSSSTENESTASASRSGSTTTASPTNIAPNATIFKKTTPPTESGKQEASSSPSLSLNNS